MNVLVRMWIVFVCVPGVLVLPAGVASADDPASDGDRPEPVRIDFGSRDTNLVKSGFVGVDHKGGFGAFPDLGWVASDGLESRDRQFVIPSGEHAGRSQIWRDFIYGPDVTAKLRVDRPAGAYRLRIWSADKDYGPHPLTVHVNGEKLIEKLSLPKMRFGKAVVDFRNTRDRMVIRLSSPTGNWILNSLELIPIDKPERTEPRIQRIDARKLKLVPGSARRAGNIADTRKVEGHPVRVGDGMKLVPFYDGRDLYRASYITFGPEGRKLYVLEADTYKDNRDRIRVLEDVDGDGRADKKKMFAPRGEWGISGALGITVTEEGVYVSTGYRKIIRLTDRDGDGRADDREVIVSGLTSPARSSATTHHHIHGPQLSPTGDLVVTWGDSRSHVPLKLPGPFGIKKLRKEGGIFFAGRDGRNVRMFARGFRNQMEVAFDSYGNMFTTDNDYGSGPPHDRLIHVVEHGDYGARGPGGGNRNIETAWNGERWTALPPMRVKGAGANGLLVYKGTAFEKLREHILACQFSQGRLVSYEKRRRGATFEVRSTRDLYRSQTLFPSDVATAPDGTLYVSTIHGNRGNGFDQGKLGCPIFRIVPRDGDPDRPEPTGSLTKQLGSPNGWIRKRARQTLIDRIRNGEQTTNMLAKQLVHSSSTQRTIELLRVCRGVNATAIAPDVRKLLSRDDPRIRTQAARTLARIGGPSDASALHEWSGETDAFAKVARMIAWAKVASERNVEPFRSMVNRSLFDRRYMLHAVTYAMALTGDVPGIEELGRASNHWKRLGALLSARFLPANEARPLIKRTMTDGNPAVRLEAILIAKDRRMISSPRKALRTAMKGPGGERFREYWKTKSRQLPGGLQINTVEQLLKHLREASKSGKRIQWVRRLSGALQAELEGREQLKNEWVEQIVAAWKRVEKPNVFRAFLPVIEILPAEDAGPLLRTLFEDRSREGGLRASALISWLNVHPDPPMEPLFPRMDDDAPQVRKAVARALAPREEYRSRVRNWYQQESNEQVRSVLALHLDSGEQPSKRTGSRGLMKGGNPDAGRRVFFHPNGPGCFTCHRVGNRGNSFGPDLTGIGQSFDRKTLLRSIRKPGRSIAIGYATWKLHLTDGQQLIGMISRQSDEEVVLQMAPQAQRTVRRDRIERKTRMDRSLMPAGLDRTITRTDLRNILAYLETLDGE